MENLLNNPVTWLVVLSILGGILSGGIWIGHVNSDRMGFSEFMAETKSVLEEIRNDIKNIFHKLPSPIAEGKSPRQLTEYGEKLSTKLHARDWAERTAPSVLTQVIGKKPFEIHNFCKEFIEKISVEEHPGVFERSYENGITDENMKIVLAIVLRDELLKQANDQE